jgi:transcriptional regulator GlxA family with amidase domain
LNTKFVFLLLPQIHILDLAGPDQTLHEAIDFGADFLVEYCGIDKEVQSSSGLPFGKIKHFSEVNFKKGDFLIIPGADYSYLSSNDFFTQKELFRFIRTQYENEVNICSICIGAFVLAESGLLNGRNCTTHFKKTKELQERYPGIKVIENILFTDQNGLYTSAGIASGIDLTLYIIEKIKGSFFAHQVARELVVYNRRSGTSSQESEMLSFRNHIHSGIHRVQDFIIANIHKKTNLADLAEKANMSERNFTRIFKKETGITVKDFITLIRKEKIIELSRNPDLSRIEIAGKVGLQSEKQLSRIIQTLHVHEK